MNATTLPVAVPSSAVSSPDPSTDAGFIDTCMTHAVICLGLRQATADKDQDALRRLMAQREASLAKLAHLVPETLDEAAALCAAAMAEKPEPSPMAGPEEQWFRDIANLLLELRATKPAALRLA